MRKSLELAVRNTIAFALPRWAKDMVFVQPAGQKIVLGSPAGSPSAVQYTWATLGLSEDTEVELIGLAATIAAADESNDYTWWAASKE